MPAATAPEDLASSAERIAADVERLAHPPYTAEGRGITRHAYTPPYAATVDFFAQELGALGFDVGFDPVGTLVARNVPAGRPALGIGSHCDANRGGGRWDGTLGCVVALEVCRLAAGRGLSLPLQVMAFLEEEGSGFGQMLLGSRIMAGRIDQAELDALTDEDGTPFLEAARAAGHPADDWRRSGQALDGLAAWLEVHIEQGRVLQDTRTQLGVVDRIAGYVHADLSISGRADHAGATPMGFRSDAGLTAAEIVVELERLTVAAAPDAVGTVGSLSLAPGLINVIPERAELTVDARSASGAHVGVFERLVAFARERAAARGQEVTVRERARVEPQPLSPAVADLAEQVAGEVGASVRRMASGAVHDTQLVASAGVPSAMLFVPCRDGISHSPAEHAEPADAALAAHVCLGALERLAAAPAA